MKKRFSGVLIGLCLSLILSGNFASLSFAQECDAYEVCTNSNGMLIENVYSALQIRYDKLTGQLVVDFDQNRGGFKIREGKKRVGLIDKICNVKFLAENFKKVPGQVGEYAVKNDKKPVDFSFTRFRDDCRHCTLTTTGIKFSPLNP